MTPLSFNAGDIEASLRLDRTPFTDELRAARADADKFAREGVTAKIGADPAKADAEIEKLKRKKPEVKGSVDLDTKKAEAKLAALKKKAESETIGAKFAEGLSQAPAWLGPAILALPAAMTVLGAATGSAVALGSALATGGIAFATYGAVAKSVITKAATAASAVQTAQIKYNASLAAGAKQATAYAAEQKAINIAYAQMSPAQIALSKQLGDLSNEWAGVQKSVTPVIAMSVQPWITGITSAMKFAKPVVTDVSGAVSSLGSTFAGLVNLPAFATFAKFIGTEGTDVIASGGGALMNFFHGFILLLPQVKPLIDDVDTAVSNLGSSFLTWSQSDAPRRDITTFLAWLHDNGPVVGRLLLSIGGALKNLGGGLLAGPAGADEIRLLSGFFGLIARLPPTFVQPITDLAASLLIISKFGFGRKVISLGVNLVGTGIAKLWNLLTPGGSIDFTGKFSGAAAMQAAADTMVTAAGAMQKAADTMFGSGAEAGAGAGVAGAEGAAGAAGAGGAAGAEGGIVRAAAGLLGKINPAFWGLALSGDSGPPQPGTPSPTSPAGLGIKPGQTAVKFLTSGPAPLSLADAEKAVALSAAGNKSAIAAMGLDPSVIAKIIKYTAASNALAKVTLHLNSAFAAGHIPQKQFAGDLTTSSVSSLKAKTLTDEYTLAIQRNGLDSGAAHTIRAQMIEDFVGQGLTAQQADKLVDTYTQGVARNGDTAAAKAKVRAQLIQDFIAAGDTAKEAAGKVDTLIGQIANIHSKSVALTVRASGSFTITDQSVSAGPGHKFQGGAATGGLVTGPGTGTSDTAGVYALSNKEYIQTADAVSHYGVPFMDAVRFKRIPKMAGGGLAGTFAGSPSGLGAFDAREWAATQSLVEQADAAVAVSALKRAIAKATAIGGLASGNAIVDFASRFVGRLPYVWGGTSLVTGADCAGFTEAVYAHFGIPIPRTSEAQFAYMQQVADRAGALAFFVSPAGGPPPGHVGISDGHGMMVNAAGTQFGTIVSSTAGNMGFGIPPNPVTGNRGPHGLPPGIRNGAQIMDNAGWLPPGLTLVDNRTGSPELLHRSAMSNRSQGAGLDQVAGLLGRLIGAVYDNAGMTADGVASAIGAAAGRESVRSAYSPRW